MEFAFKRKNGITCLETVKQDLLSNLPQTDSSGRVTITWGLDHITYTTAGNCGRSDSFKIPQISPFIYYLDCDIDPFDYYEGA